MAPARFRNPLSVGVTCSSSERAAGRRRGRSGPGCGTSALLPPAATSPAEAELAFARRHSSRSNGKATRTAYSHRCRSRAF